MIEEKIIKSWPRFQVTNLEVHMNAPYFQSHHFCWPSSGLVVLQKCIWHLCTTSRVGRGAEKVRSVHRDVLASPWGDAQEVQAYETSLKNKAVIWLYLQ